MVIAMNWSSSAERKLILVTGPTRSGKSEWAEQLAMQSGRSVMYIATAQRDETDLEWQARLLKHQQRRPATWKTCEVPIELAATVRSAAATDCLLIDALGTWLANLLDQDDITWQAQVTDLLTQLERSPAVLIVVAEETGWGVVPAYPMGRLFRDRLGDLTRQIGAMADAVYLVTGGYALNLCQLGEKIPAKRT